MFKWKEFLKLRIQLVKEEIQAKMNFIKFKEIQNHKYFEKSHVELEIYLEK